MFRKRILGVQLSTVFNIVPLMENNLYANFCIYFFDIKMLLNAGEV